MRKTKRILVLLGLGLLTTACEGPPPVALEPPFDAMRGEWYHFKEVGSPDTRHYLTDRRYLKVFSDGTTVYASCYVKIEGASSVRTSVDPVPSRITELNDSGFRVRASLPLVDVVGMDFDFKFNAMPYEENDRWYMKVDDAIWVRRRSTEQQPLTDWKCPET
ncbi:MAG: hypothetical protein ACPG4N_07650 [Gammaproteobacteria bacterium]